MAITLDQLFTGIEAKNGFPLDPPQREAISAGDGPLLIAAGPGTGKTEVLVARTLKFICCDGVDPGSIVLTTFTEKAAKSLQDRLSEALASLVAAYGSLSGIDASALRVGTIHSLCNDILQEYRYTAYQNLRLLDDIESALLVHRIYGASEPLKNACSLLYEAFKYLFDNKPLQLVTRWEWSLTLQLLLNRLVEDRLSLESLSLAGGAYQALCEASAIYDEKLAQVHGCDFARLLRHFVTFLETGQGRVFLLGDTAKAPLGSATLQRLPLTHVLVDEYQDTNPLQEEIYLALCSNGAHNLTVVGDDDQALYRFRGGTVECMVGFAAACRSRWNVAPRVIYLADNHRSTTEIVDWCGQYVGSFPAMAIADARIPGKPPLRPTRGSAKGYPAVSLIRGQTIEACSKSVASLVRGLLSNGVITDYSQCVLLLRSARNSPRYAGPYVNELGANGIPVYNPRSKDFLDQDEVAQCLGAFIRIIDPNLTKVPVPQKAGSSTDRIRQLIISWVKAYDDIAVNHQRLREYVIRSAQSIAQKGTEQLITQATPTILYRILSHSPFVEHQRNPAADLRLGKLTRLFESFCSQYGRPLWTDKASPGQLAGFWYGVFYYSLCGYLAQKGLDDDEDEDSVCPKGYFPIMTVHQAKGLEFDFVFVGNLGGGVSPNFAHRLEEDLRLFRLAPPAIVHPIEQSMWHDEVRQHFVAYSRARKALILVATEGQLRKTGGQTASFGGNGGGWVKQQLPRL